MEEHSCSFERGWRFESSRAGNLGIKLDHQTKETALAVKSPDNIPENFTGVALCFGDYRWFVNGKRHREDGPAVEYFSGSTEWYLNGKLHRIDGPAIIYSIGKKRWFLNGREYFFQEEWFESLTPEQKEKAVWNMDNW